MEISQPIPGWGAGTASCLHLHHFLNPGRVRWGRCIRGQNPGLNRAWRSQATQRNAPAVSACQTSPNQFASLSNFHTQAEHLAGQA
jgi:hypothetical protein